MGDAPSPLPEPLPGFGESLGQEVQHFFGHLFFAVPLMFVEPPEDRPAHPSLPPGRIRGGQPPVGPRSPVHPRKRLGDRFKGVLLGLEADALDVVHELPAFHAREMEIGVGMDVGMIAPSPRKDDVNVLFIETEIPPEEFLQEVLEALLCELQL